MDLRTGRKPGQARTETRNGPESPPDPRGDEELAARAGPAHGIPTSRATASTWLAGRCGTGVGTGPEMADPASVGE
jgi:hypothetical protein